MAKYENGLSRREQRAQDELREVRAEGFVSRNIKPITFLVCVAVILSVFGVISFLVLNQDWSFSNGKEMTQADVISLSAYGQALTMEQLQEFEGDLEESERTAYYYIRFDHYQMIAIEDKVTKTMKSCTLRDNVTDQVIDIRTDDVAAFFKSTK